MKDPHYERERNKLIEQAGAIAYKETGRRPLGIKKKIAWGAAWNLVFHQTMNKLAYEAGLGGCYEHQ